MDLSKKKKLDTVTVFDLMGNNFYIPDYQRGYRWTKLEVEKLLTDLEKFLQEHPNDNAFYSMQPLVVYHNEEEDAWEVIDGQQRLTTLYLILNSQKDLLEQVYSEMKLFRLAYQSRPGSGSYLSNIEESKKNENIDYYHIFQASQAIKEFLNGETNFKPQDFVDLIVNNTDNRPSVKFIWYNVTEEIKEKNISPEDKFSDLNIGKIGLTNAELIKAQFLHTVGKNESEALRIASEWDHIEHSLQDGEFWSFLYGKEDGKYATRIEFLFDIIKNKQPTEPNDYYTFDQYTKDIEEKAKSEDQVLIVKKLWKDITDKFYLYRGWFEDNRLYHIIGYLRYKELSIKTMEDMYNDPETLDKECFFEKLKKKALETINQTEDIRELNYKEDSKKIRSILVLFNILSIIECEKDNVRFSFKEFYGNKWDIEHIRSQTPQEVDGGGKKDWIVCNIEYFSGVNHKNYQLDSPEGFEQYKTDVLEKAEQITDELAQGYTVKRICEKLLTLYRKTDEKITDSEIYEILNKQVFKQGASFDYVDQIGNLVLLDQGTNRGYKNAFFPVKRKWIYRREREGIYILPCTKNAFSKNYSKTIFDLMNWNDEDAEAYMEEIERVIRSGRDNGKA